MRDTERALHHRKLRSAGGEHSEINLLAVHHRCHNGHTNSIHARPERSYRLGHIVRSWQDPADVPVTVLPNLLSVVA
jgi:hypothetical protein